MGYGEKMKALRAKKNMTQREAADRLGCSIVSIEKYEREERVPRDEMKIAISKLYGRSVSYIFFANEGHKS